MVISLEEQNAKYILDKYPQISEEDKYKVLAIISMMRKEVNKLGMEISQMILRYQTPQNVRKSISKKEFKAKWKK